MSFLYLDHFGLNKPPFKITPDLDFFFSGGRRGDTLSALLHVAKHEEGIITVVAEVGSGKTMLSRLMLSKLGTQVSTVYLPNPCFSRDEILSAIARDLGLSNLPLSPEARLSALQQELLRRHALDQRVLLVVDEAHAMPPESLEEIRLLSNLETQSHKLINIMLFGQPELDTLLADPRLRQVRDRVIHRFELQALPDAEACAYIDHRLRAAGWKGGALFTPGALAHLVRAAGGRVRRLNLLADKSLLCAYAEGELLVQVQQVKDAIHELYTVSAKPGLGVRGQVWGWAAASVVLASAVTMLALSQLEQRHHTLASSAPAQSMASVAMLQSAAFAPPKEQEELQAQEPAAPLPKTPTQAAQSMALSASEPTSKPEPSLTGLEAYLTRTRTALNLPNLERYAIQIASIPRMSSAVEYIQFVCRYLEPTLVFAQLSTYNGRNFVSVYYGSYDTIHQAKLALAALPEVLKTNKPIVRTWAKIKMDGAFEKTNNHELL